MGIFGAKTVTCDVCGDEAGIKGNKRYKVHNGYACEKCIGAAFPNSINGAGPNAFDKCLISELKGMLDSSDQGFEVHYQAMIKEMDTINTTSYTSSVLEQVKCLRCGSDQIAANQKGFGVAKAVVGAAIAGPLGLAAGNLGAKKVRITCLKCGHQWEAGKA